VTLSVLPLVALSSSACGPATEASGAVVERGKALGYSAALATLRYFDGRAAARYQAQSEAVRSDLKARGGSLDEYDAAMAEWSKATGYDETEARITRATAALELVRKWLNDEGDRDTARAAIDDAAEALGLLLDELTSQGVTVPEHVTKGVEAARGLAQWVT
jgi:hypothetical protein